MFYVDVVVVNAVMGTIAVYLTHVKPTSSLTSVDVHFRMHYLRFASFAKLHFSVTTYTCAVHAILRHTTVIAH